MKSVTRSVTVRALGKRTRIARVMVAVAFAGLFTAACDDSSGPRTIATVVISPTTATIPVSGTQQFTVVITDSEGNVLANREPVWSVAAEAALSASGLFTAGTVAGIYQYCGVTCSGVTARDSHRYPRTARDDTVDANRAQWPSRNYQYTESKRRQQQCRCHHPVVPSLTEAEPQCHTIFTAVGAGTFANTVMATSGSIIRHGHSHCDSGPVTLSRSRKPTRAQWRRSVHGVAQTPGQRRSDHACLSVTMVAVRHRHTVLHRRLVTGLRQHCTGNQWLELRYGDCVVNYSTISNRESRHGIAPSVSLPANRHLRQRPVL